MRVGYAQLEPIFLDVEGNLQKIARAVEEAGEFDVLVFPELMTSGYAFESVEEAFAASLEVSKLVDRISAMSPPGMVVIGFAERYDGRLFNSAVAVLPDGDYYLYRKVHLFDKEKLWFSPGNLGFDVFEWRGYRFGMMICFDWVFPEAARILALKGADLILHPANLVLPYCQEAMKIRCLENGVFAITANRIGSERGLTFTGMSQITGNRGEVLVRGPKETEEIRLVDVDLWKARDKTLGGKNNLIGDRRPEWYGELVR